MSAPKHTAGPWVARGRFIGTPNHMSFIAECRDQNGNWSDGPMAEANARLIAAAPDLLEAAMAMVAGRPTECPVDPVMGKGGVAYDNWLKLNALRAAIAKATGESAS